MYEIKPLYSVPIYIDSNTEYKFFEKEIKFINSLRYEEKSSGCKLSKDTYIFKHSIMNRIKKECENHLRVYTKKVLEIEQKFYITNSWITKKERGQFHNWHNHPNSAFSGVFYINVEGSDSKLWFKGTPQFSPFNLEYHHSNFNLYNSTKYWIPVQTGTMVIFPSHIEHSVNPNNFYDNRIVIGFNSFIEGNFGNAYADRLHLVKSC